MTTKMADYQMMIKPIRDALGKIILQPFEECARPGLIESSILLQKKAINYHKKSPLEQNYCLDRIEAMEAILKGKGL